MWLKFLAAPQSASYGEMSVTRTALYREALRSRAEVRPVQCRRFHLSLAAVVMPFDLLDADGFRHARHLIEIAKIIREIWKFVNVTGVAFEWE